MSNEYQSLFADYDDCSAKVLKITCGEETSYLPLLIKEIGNGYKEAYSPYGYGGLWGNYNLNESDVENLRKFFAAEAIVAVFIRNSPFLENEKQWPRKYLELNKKTYQRRLKKYNDFDQCIQDFPQKVRWSVNRALRANLTCRFLPLAKCPKDNLSRFYQLYVKLMNVKNITGYLLFSEKIIFNHGQFLGNSCELLEIISSEGDNMIGGALFMLDDTGRVHYHLSAATEEAMKLQAMEFLLATSIYRYGKLGYMEIHLGGGHKLDEDDGLSRFKSKFADRKLEFHCLALVCDEVAYKTERARLPLARPSLFLISDSRGALPNPNHVKFAGQV